MDILSRLDVRLTIGERRSGRQGKTTQKNEAAKKTGTVGTPASSPPTRRSKARCSQPSEPTSTMTPLDGSMPTGSSSAATPAVSSSRCSALSANATRRAREPDPSPANPAALRASSCTLLGADRRGDDTRFRAGGRSEAVIPRRVNANVSSWILKVGRLRSVHGSGCQDAMSFLPQRFDQRAPTTRLGPSPRPARAQPTPPGRHSRTAATRVSRRATRRQPGAQNPTRPPIDVHGGTTVHTSATMTARWTTGAAAQGMHSV